MAYAKVMVADRGAAEPISLGAALLAGKKVAPDATELLVMDHLEAMAFFDRYLLTRDPVVKLGVGARICALLSAHMQVEEEILYPAAEESTGDKTMVDQARAEHAEAKAVIARLDRRDVADDDYDAGVLRLRGLIEQHVAEEEMIFFPKVRDTELDLRILGRQIAARRAELLTQITGRRPQENDMQTNKMDVGRTPTRDAETAALAIDPEAARELFLVGLRNAHATEQECRTMVKRQIERLENYPRMEARLTRHLAETEAQIERLEQILESLGESPSGLKDAAMTVSANMGAMAHAAAGDEVLKNSLANAAMAQFEIAAYRSLIVLGEAAGEATSLRLLQQSLSEERAMAAWLEENLPGTVTAFLQLRSAGETAKH